MENFDPSQPGQQSNPQQPQTARPIPIQPGASPQAPANRPVPAGGNRPQSAATANRPVAVTEANRKALVQTKKPAEGEEEEGHDELDTVMKGAPPWLISALVHMTILIVLGLIVIASKARNTIELVVEPEDKYAEELGEQLIADDLNMPIEETLVDEAVITPENLQPVDDPFASPAEVKIDPLSPIHSQHVDAPMVGVALSGREIGSKNALLGKYGGTKLTEEAVKKALEWLKRQQHNDGGWSLAGPYTDGANTENREAATAMALLAFQGAGHTTKKGEHKDVVARGWNWLLKKQDDRGNFFHQGLTHHRLYTQGQCSIAICELYGMTQDEKYRKPAELAIDFCLKSQDPIGGGWRYNPGADSDTSVTGWMLMALQSAKMAGIDVPQENLDRMSKFLDSVAQEGGRRYLYQPNSHGGPAMTAEGLLCRQYLGWKHDDERLLDGVKYINSVGMDWGNRDVYYWYYATQVLHHVADFERAEWDQWNKVMRELLPAKQVKSGPEEGSWNVDGDRWGELHGGRLYITCLTVYDLEVYYRHLPIYQKKAVGF